MMGFLPQGRVFVDELKPSEADVLVDIHADAFARAWSADEFAALIADRAVVALAARRESIFGVRRMVGFALLRKAADEAEILTIAVRKGNRGKGFGRLLMEEALRRLYRERIASCFLEVDQSNAAAVSLYRSLGFVTVGERKGYYPRPEGGGAALVMRAQVR